MMQTWLAFRVSFDEVACEIWNGSIDVRGCSLPEGDNRSIERVKCGKLETLSR